MSTHHLHDKTLQIKERKKLIVVELNKLQAFELPEHKKNKLIQLKMKTGKCQMDFVVFYEMR